MFVPTDIHNHTSYIMHLKDYHSPSHLFCTFHPSLPAVQQFQRLLSCSSVHFPDVAITADVMPSGWTFISVAWITLIILQNFLRFHV